MISERKGTDCLIRIGTICIAHTKNLSSVNHSDVSTCCCVTLEVA